MNLTQELESLRRELALPALGASLVIKGKPTEVWVTGTRRWEGTDAAHTSDAFHLGSNTKAMTAALVGLAREQGKLMGETSLGEVIPDLLVETAPEWKAVTVEALLAHQAGLTRLEPEGKSLGDLHRFTGPLPQQRERWLRERLVTPPDKTHKTYSYSNAGYILLGMLTERVWGQAWETLVVERLWKPLRVTGGGFGAAPQLWQHKRIDKKTVALPLESRIDNPPLLGPAGRIHLPMADWARFVALFTEEGAGVLKPETVRWLTTPLMGGAYAGGWQVLDRAWAGGTALTHAGSNTMNYAVVWVAPKKHFAVLVATNVAGEGVPQACDVVVGRLLRAAKG